MALCRFVPEWKRCFVRMTLEVLLPAAGDSLETSSWVASSGPCVVRWLICHSLIQQAYIEQLLFAKHAFRYRSCVS